jgi:aminodeoxyfutalosine synthase
MSHEATRLRHGFGGAGEDAKTGLEMATFTSFDRYTEGLAAGERLSAEELAELAAMADVLPVGMLADTAARRLHQGQVTFLRVAFCTAGEPAVVPPAARELRLAQTPETLNDALTAIAAAKETARGAAVSSLAWSDVQRLAGADLRSALKELRAAGLDALAHVPLDAIAEPAVALEAMRAAGFDRITLTIDKAPAADRLALLSRAQALEEQFGGVQALNPLPMSLNAFRPTTGYDDVKMVALARLAAPGIPSIQVDWPRYGPKLAQVALTFGADDIYGVSASDEAPEGRRRAPLEEIRRNIESAGFAAVERDGRFALRQ